MTRVRPRPDRSASNELSRPRRPSLVRPVILVDDYPEGRHVFAETWELFEWQAVRADGHCTDRPARLPGSRADLPVLVF